MGTYGGSSRVNSIGRLIRQTRYLQCKYSDAYGLLMKSISLFISRYFRKRGFLSYITRLRFQSEITDPAGALVS